MDCPHCGKEIEDEEVIEIIDTDERMRIDINTDDAIDFVFTKLLREGYVPRSKEIYKIIEYYQDYMDEQIMKFVRGVMSTDETDKDDDNSRI